MNLFKDFIKQGFGCQHLCRLKRCIPSMGDKSGSELDRFFPNGPQRPVSFPFACPH